MTGNNTTACTQHGAFDCPSCRPLRDPLESIQGTMEEAGKRFWDKQPPLPDVAGDVEAALRHVEMGQTYEKFSNTSQYKVSDENASRYEDAAKIIASALRELRQKMEPPPTFEVTGIVEDGEKTIVGLTGSYVHVFADEFYKEFKRSGAINYMEASFNGKGEDSEKFTVTIQRVKGKTLHEMKLDVELLLSARTEELRLEREALEDRDIQLGNMASALNGTRKCIFRATEILARQFGEDRLNPDDTGAMVEAAALLEDIPEWPIYHTIEELP